jgi:hypothetical protein
VSTRGLSVTRTRDLALRRRLLCPLSYEPWSVLARIRTRGLVVRNDARYPLRHEDTNVGGERFELPGPKPRLYGSLVSPLNSPPVG